MQREILSVREIRKQDIGFITNYWLHSSPAFMRSIGVEINKIPAKDQWKEMLMEQISQPYKKKIVLHHLGTEWGSYRSFQYQ